MSFLGYTPFVIEAKTIGDQIRNLRFQKGLSQKIMAKLIDIDPSTLAAWEKNKGRPDIKKVEKLLKGLT